MRLHSALPRAALLAVLFTAPLSAILAAPAVPISAFANEDQYAHPRLAPDGKHIAITVRVPAGERPVPVLMIDALPGLKMDGAIRLPVFEVPLDYRWVSNNRLVIAPVLMLHGAGRQLPFGASAGIGVPKAVYFDEANPDAQLHKLLSQQFPGSWVSFDSFSQDGNLLLFGVASDRDPGSYYLYDKRTGKADLLFSSMEQIDPEQMAERRPISFATRDGHTLHGYLTMPRHAAGARLPMVLLPHGGPHDVADEWFFDPDAQFLASRGYAVLQVNFRGSNGRGLSFRHAGYRQWGGKIQDDLVDGVRWAIGQGEVDAKRIYVYGASFGGYSALMLAACEPGMFRCAVGYAGVYDLNQMASTGEAKASKRLRATLARTIGTDKAELDRYSPAMQAERITIPVLLVHGGKDKRAPLAQAEAMRAALVKAGHPPEWLVAPNEGHGFYDTRNVTEFYQRLEAFLARHLGP
jgi:dipeptidyl aminopeptidase/acylaminoacyl peptidase